LVSIFILEGQIIFIELPREEQSYSRKTQQIKQLTGLSPTQTSPHQQKHKTKTEATPQTPNRKPEAESRPHHQTAALTEMDTTIEARKALPANPQENPNSRQEFIS
jgi:hypothetical protein